MKLIKGMNFHTLISATVLALPLISLNPLMALADQRDFQLINDSSVIIDEVYVSTINTDDWEEDILGQDILPSGESVNITFSRDADGTCAYDIKVVTEPDTSVVLPNVNLCGTVNVIFNGSSLTTQ